MEDAVGHLTLFVDLCDMGRWRVVSRTWLRKVYANYVLHHFYRGRGLGPLSLQHLLAQMHRLGLHSLHLRLLQFSRRFHARMITTSLSENEYFSGHVYADPNKHEIVQHFRILRRHLGILSCNRRVYLGSCLLAFNRPYAHKKYSVLSPVCNSEDALMEVLKSSIPGHLWHDRGLLVRLVQSINCDGPATWIKAGRILLRRLCRRRLALGWAHFCKMCGHG